MTICIAAIGTYSEKNSQKEALVFATDHMITMQQIGQFEHSIEKYRKINSETVVMLAGEALLFGEILEGINSKDNFEKIKAKIHTNMIKLRDERVKKEF